MGAMVLGISVAIRTRDKEKHFDSLLESLSFQTVLPSQLIVINNYSSELARRSLKSHLIKECSRVFIKEPVNVKLVSLSDDEFSHAYSTNLGVATADNELVCITNAHSLPISAKWLENGVKYFADTQVAGVSGYFVPDHRGGISAKLDKAVYQFTQKSVLHQDWCSTINCVIRKSLWQVYPFDENLPNIIPETTRYGLEDYDWSKEMIARSFKIIVDPAFSVYHSHGNFLNETERNLRSYFVYRRLQKKINSLKRPRASYSSVFDVKQKLLTAEVIS